mgnify:CR=1 FL=1
MYRIARRKSETVTVAKHRRHCQQQKAKSDDKNDVLRADKPVLVDFWAQWCPYCRRIAPAFDKVGEQYADTLISGKINYDEEPQLIQRFGIDTIPTLMLFKDGEVLGSIVAPASKAAIETFIQETLAQ